MDVGESNWQPIMKIELLRLGNLAHLLAAAPSPQDATEVSLQLQAASKGAGAMPPITALMAEPLFLTKASAIRAALLGLVGELEGRPAAVGSPWGGPEV